MRSSVTYMNEDQWAPRLALTVNAPTSASFGHCGKRKVRLTIGCENLCYGQAATWAENYGGLDSFMFWHCLLSNASCLQYQCRVIAFALCSLALPSWISLFMFWNNPASSSLMSRAPRYPPVIKDYGVAHALRYLKALHLMSQPKGNSRTL